MYFRHRFLGYFPIFLELFRLSLRLLDLAVPVRNSRLKKNIVNNVENICFGHLRRSSAEKNSVRTVWQRQQVELGNKRGINLISLACSCNKSMVYQTVPVMSKHKFKHKNLSSNQSRIRNDESLYNVEKAWELSSLFEK